MSPSRRASGGPRLSAESRRRRAARREAARQARAARQVRAAAAAPRGDHPPLTTPVVARRAPLDVDGTLTIDGPAGPLLLAARADRIVLEAPTLRSALGLLRALPTRRRWTAARRLGRLLAAADLILELRLRGRRLVRLGATRRGLRPPGGRAA